MRAEAPADAYETAAVLDREAREASRRGDDARASALHAEAYAALGGCNPGSSMLLVAVAEAAKRAARATDGRQTICDAIGVLERSGCAAEIREVDRALAGLHEAADGRACAPVSPLSRGPGEEILAPIDPPALAPAIHDAPTVAVEPAPALPVRRRGPAIAGGVMVALGAAALGGTTAGMVAGHRLDRQVEGECDPDLVGPCAALDRDGRRMNAVATALGVSATALVITGVVLLARMRRSDRARVSPAAARGPLQLTVRF